MRHAVFTLLLSLPAASLHAAEPQGTVGDVVAKRQATWAAEDGAGERESTPVQTPVGRGVPGAPVTLPVRAVACGHHVDATQADDASADDVEAAAEAALYEVVRAKLAAADAVAARAASSETKRISLAEFQLLVQRTTCTAAHGSLERGAGAACMAKPAVGPDVDLDDNEEAQLCIAQGGVLVSRMDPCLQATSHLAGLHADEAASVGLEALVGAFADVARQCWGRTICVE